MAILNDPKMKSAAIPPAVGTSRATEMSEDTPLLLPPPSYTPSESAPFSTSVPGSAGELEAQNYKAKRTTKGWRKFWCLVLLCIILGATVGFNGLRRFIRGGSSIGEYDDGTWKDTSPLPGKASPAPSSSSSHRYSRPGSPFPSSVPLYYETTTLTLSPSSSLLQFHGLGSDARGSLRMVDVQDSGEKRVIVEIQSIYADHDRYMDRVRIHKVVGDNSEGVWILTPPSSVRYPYSHRAIDWISFDVTIYVPSSKKAQVLSAFNGSATSMQFDYAPSKLSWSNTFCFATRNAKITVSTPLTVDEKATFCSTNGAISFTSPLTSSYVSITTTNSAVTFSAPVNVTTDLFVKSTNGAIRSLDTTAGRTIDIATTNSRIEGLYSTPKGLAVTTNGILIGEWRDISESLTLTTSNAKVDVKIGLASSTSKKESRVPVAVKTTNGHSKVLFTCQPATVAVDFSSTTSNDGLEITMAPNFLGQFELYTSNSEGISTHLGAGGDFERRIGNVSASKGRAAGSVVRDSGKKTAEGSIVGHTSNGKVFVTL